jgi:hypothetical protein
MLGAAPVPLRLPARLVGPTWLGSTSIPVCSKSLAPRAVRPPEASSGSNSAQWRSRDRFPEDAFDAVASCLTFSELSPEEQSYVLKVLHSRMRPGGTIVIADEVFPRTRARRLWYRLGRLPVALLTFALTQTTTRPIQRLAKRLSEAGFVAVEEERLPSGAFSIVSGVKEEVHRESA